MYSKRISYLRLLMFVFTGSVLLLSCAAKRSQNVTQGAEGYINKLTGNQMPMVGKPPATPRGMAAVIYIYEAATTKQAEGMMPVFSKVNTRLVAKAKSDNMGHYKVALPSGTYSILIEQDAGLFAAETDGQGILTPVTVSAGKVSQRNVTVTLGAAF